jgi:hypothetical protein
MLKKIDGLALCPNDFHLDSFLVFTVSVSDSYTGQQVCHNASIAVMTIFKEVWWDDSMICAPVALL